MTTEYKSANKWISMFTYFPFTHTCVTLTPLTNSGGRKMESGRRVRSFSPKWFNPKCNYSKKQFFRWYNKVTAEVVVFLFFFFVFFCFCSLGFPIDGSYFLPKSGPLHIKIKTNTSYEIRWEMKNFSTNISETYLGPYQTLMMEF